MIALLARDLKLSVRAGGGALIGVLFFMTVVAVIPFGVGPDLNLLSRIGPAILWIGALLAGWLADALGVVPAMLWFIAGTVVAGVSMAFTPVARRRHVGVRTLGTPVVPSA